MAAETLLTEEWLDDVLTGDSALSTAVGGRFIAHVAPQGQAMPCVHVEYQPTPGIVSSLDSSPVVSGLLYSICAMGKGRDMTALRTAANRIDAVLVGQRADTDELRIRVTKVQAVSLPEVVFGTNVYSKLGGIYRISVSPKG